MRCTRSPKLFLLILSTAFLAGCTSPTTEVPGDPERNDARHIAVSAPWHLQTKTSLGHYETYQVPFASLSKAHEGYCRAIYLGVPAGATRLALSLAYNATENATDGSYGLLGFSAQSPSGDPWVDYPGTFDQHRWGDNPKNLTFDNPEAGKWRIYSYTMGAAVKQRGSLTIDVEGASTETPAALNIELDC